MQTVSSRLLAPSGSGNQDTECCLQLCLHYYMTLPAGVVGGRGCFFASSPFLQGLSGWPGCKDSQLKVWFRLAINAKLSHYYDRNLGVHNIRDE